MKTQVINGNSLEVLKGMADNSIDSIVTDPPYGLSNHKPHEIASIIENWVHGRDCDPGGKGFMGKDWDKFVPGPEIWKECLRVLKPGGHALIFAGSRTVDLMGLSVRLAGFEIRDQMQWIYASGFPKSLNVSKAIDKSAGAERDVVGPGKWNARKPNGSAGLTSCGLGSSTNSDHQETAPATDAEKQWDGWGTALKPAHEPIIVARKPFKGTVANNVQTHGTGGINIDGCRVGTGNEKTKAPTRRGGSKAWFTTSGKNLGGDDTKGRWPANVIFDESAGAMLDEQSGERKSSGGGGRSTGIRGGAGAIWGSAKIGHDGSAAQYHGTGGASRFFYCPKASKAEREAGLTPENMLCSCKPEELEAWANEDQSQKTDEKAVSRAKDTAGSSETDANSWNTDGCGNSTTDEKCRTDGTSTTSTMTSKTTGSKTSNSLTGRPTSASTQAAKSETGNGSSRAQSAGKKSRLEKSIGISASRDGRCTEDVGRATSHASSEVSGIAVCELCNKWCSLPSAGALTGGRAEDSDGLKSPRAGAGRTSTGRLNIHSTVKPIALMRYLVRLVTPPGGTVLDPFTGSGTTGCAAALEGFEFTGVELSEEYCEIARARIAHREGEGCS